jgi:hypothetical protein
MKKYNVISIKWGTKYSAEDVNKLANSIKRNTSYDIDFYCFTDNAIGLNKEIIACDLPVLHVSEEFCFGNHRKETGLCDDNLAGLTGQRVFFFDLDSLIIGNLDPFFEYPKDDQFYIINDWAHRRGKKANKIGQASCYSFVVGTLGFVKTYFENHPKEVIQRFGTATQEFLSFMVIQKYGKLNFWPDDWFKSFRFHCLPHPLLRWFMPPSHPHFKNAKMIAFHGEPGISEAIEGVWCRDPSSKKYPHGYKKIYKHILPTKWIEDYWK